MLDVGWYGMGLTGKGFENWDLWVVRGAFLKVNCLVLDSLFNAEWPKQASSHSKWANEKNMRDEGRPENSNGNGNEKMP